MTEFHVVISRDPGYTRYPSRYIRCAVLECASWYYPTRIDTRPRGVLRVVQVWNRRYDGGPRSQGALACAAARELCAKLNATARRPDPAEPQSAFGADLARLLGSLGACSEWRSWALRQESATTALESAAAMGNVAEAFIAQKLDRSRPRPTDAHELLLALRMSS